MSSVDDIAADAPQDEREQLLYRMRHSAAHVMASAVRQIFPDVKIAIGPPVENGFYYDMQLPRALTQDDLREIERRMAEYVKMDAPFVRNEITREQALEQFADQPFKVEIARELPEGATISTYTHADFTDLCRGPHVESTGKIGAYKLTTTSGAYWRGNEKNPMLTRLYGTAWPTQAELDTYLHNLEEAAKRDHRKLGRELDLFSVHEDYGPGMIYWHPKGATIRMEVENFWKREHIKRGYQIVYTPHVVNEQVYVRSGHLGSYDAMYSPMQIDEQNYYVKPMNCPGHMAIYNSNQHSYRELPLRIAELGTVYRYERSGVLHGMLRVRGFTQDDAHLFMRPDQLNDELDKVLELTDFMMKTFGYTFNAFLSTRPEKSIGNDEVWANATESLRQALVRNNIPYKVDEGGGAFYGPKIDINLLDSLGRGWQGPTIQVDFNQPDRFDVEYVGEDGGRHRAVMIHRTVLGSMERFVGGLIEHYAGKFPVWLAPVQVKLIPIADRHIEYASSVAEQMRAHDIRVEVDGRAERMNAKLRDAQLQKIPFMLIIGDKEIEANAAAVRLQTGEDLKAQPVDDIIASVLNHVATRSLSLDFAAGVKGELKAPTA